MLREEDSTPDPKLNEFPVSFDKKGLVAILCIISCFNLALISTVFGVTILMVQNHSPQTIIPHVTFFLNKSAPRIDNNFLQYPHKGKNLLPNHQYNFLTHLRRKLMQTQKVDFKYFGPKPEKAEKSKFQFRLPIALDDKIISKRRMAFKRRITEQEQVTMEESKPQQRIGFSLTPNFGDWLIFGLLGTFVGGCFVSCLISACLTLTLAGIDCFCCYYLQYIVGKFRFQFSNFFIKKVVMVIFRKTIPWRQIDLYYRKYSPFEKIKEGFKNMTIKPRVAPHKTEREIEEEKEKNALARRSAKKAKKLNEKRASRGPAPITVPNTQETAILAPSAQEKKSINQ